MCVCKIKCCVLLQHQIQADVIQDLCDTVVLRNGLAILQIFLGGAILHLTVHCVLHPLSISGVVGNHCTVWITVAPF